MESTHWGSIVSFGALIRNRPCLFRQTGPDASGPNTLGFCFHSINVTAGRLATLLLHLLLCCLLFSSPPPLAAGMCTQVAFPRGSENPAPNPHLGLPLSLPLPPPDHTNKAVKEQIYAMAVDSGLSKTFINPPRPTRVSSSPSLAQKQQAAAGRCFNLSCRVVPRPNYEVTVMLGMHMNHSVQKITDGKQSVAPPTEGCL